MTVYLVCGGRNFDDYDLLRRTLNDRSVTAVIHGGAKGADSLAGAWAKKRGLPVIKVDANWNYYSASGGSIRNSWMLEFIRIDIVLAFPGGIGTANMIKQAIAAGIPVKEIK